MSSSGLSESIRLQSFRIAESILGPPVRTEGPNGWWRVSWREDRNPSLSVLREDHNGVGAGYWKDWGTGDGGDVFELWKRVHPEDAGLRFPDLVEKIAVFAGISVSGGGGRHVGKGELACGYGLLWEDFERSGCVWVDEKGGAVGYPVLLLNGSVVMKWKGARRDAETGKRKSWGEKGSGFAGGLFVGGGDSLVRCMNRTLVITEGEEKAIAVRRCGVLAVSGAAGAGNFSLDAARMVLGGAPSRIVFAFDADEAGAKGQATALSRLLSILGGTDGVGVPRPEFRAVRWASGLKPGYDVTDVMVDGGKDAVIALLKGAEEIISGSDARGDVAEAALPPTIPTKDSSGFVQQHDDSAGSDGGYWNPREEDNPAAQGIEDSECFVIDDGKGGVADRDELYGALLWRKYSLDEIIAMEIPKRDELVGGILLNKQVVLVSGKGGSLKTMLLMDMAICLCMGSNWLIPKDNDDPKNTWCKVDRPHRVLFYNADTGTDSMLYRAKAIARAHQYDVRHGIANAPEGGGLFELVSCPIEGGRLDMTKPLMVESFKETIRRDRYDIVFIDNLKLISGAADENDASQMAPIMGILRQIAEELGVTIVLIHHHTKQDSYRGSSTIEDLIDAHFIVKRKDKETPIIEIVPGKQRDIEVKSFTARFEFELNDLTRNLHWVRFYPEFAVSENSGAEEKITELLGLGEMSINQLVKLFKEEGCFSRDQMYSALANLEDKEVIEWKRGDRNSKLYRLRSK